MNVLFIVAPILMALHGPSYFSERVKSLSYIFAQIGKPSISKEYTLPPQLKNVRINSKK